MPEMPRFCQSSLSASLRLAMSREEIKDDAPRLRHAGDEGHHHAIAHENAGHRCRIRLAQIAFARRNLHHFGVRPELKTTVSPVSDFNADLKRVRLELGDRAQHGFGGLRASQRGAAGHSAAIFAFICAWRSIRRLPGPWCRSSCSRRPCRRT